jgi:hypothetical protein
MSMYGFPHHHTEQLCTIVHYQGGGFVYDYCTVCLDSFVCFGAWRVAREQGDVKDSGLVASRCEHPVTDVSEPYHRGVADRVPAGHESLMYGNCTYEHYQDPTKALTGDQRVDTAIVYDRCTGCGSTSQCPTIGSGRSCSFPPTSTDFHSTTGADSSTDSTSASKDTD